MIKNSVLIIHPDVERFENITSADIFPAIGMGYLTTFLNQNGFNVACLDSYFFLLSSTEYTHKDFLKKAEEKIIEFSPDIVGITAISHTRKKCFEIARMTKSIDRNIKVVMGGPYATLMYEPILYHYHEFVDYVVRGEGEETFTQLAKSVGKGEKYPEITGISFFKDGKVHTTPLSPRIQNIDKISFPDYSYHASLSPDGKFPTIGLISIRGCPYGCKFCGSHAFWGTNYKFRSPENVADELVYFKDKYGTDNFKFHDDTFTVPRERAINIFKAIIKRGIRANFYIHTMIDKVDKELLELYKEAGGKSIYYGLESGSKRIRKKMGKPFVDFDSFIENVKIMKELNLFSGVFILLGYPGETIEDIYDTYSLLKTIDPDDIYISSTKIQPKTDLYEESIRSGIHRPEDWLNEDIEYFPFVHGKDRELVDGFLLLFDEIYRKKTIRTEFEINNEPNALRHRRSNWQELKENAKKALDDFARTKNV